VATRLSRNRDFMLLWIGQSVSVIGTRVSSIAFPLLVLAITGSPAKAGLVGFAATIPYLLLYLPAGGLVDRWDRRRTMLVCDATRTVALATIPVAIWTHQLTMVHVVVVAFVDGAFFVFFGLAETAALPRVVPPEQLSAALARNEARSRGAALAGQPLGGLLFELGHAIPFLADAISYAVSVVTLIFIRTDLRIRSDTPRNRLHREIAEGARWLWRQPFLRATAILVAFGNAIFQALVLVVIVLARSHGASGGEVGILLAGFGAGGLLGSLIATSAQRRVPAKVVVIGASWLWALLFLPLALPITPLALIPILAAMAALGPIWNVVIETFQLRIVPDRLLGRVESVILVMAWGAIPLGSIAAGFMLEWWGPTTSVLVLAGSMTAVALAATISRSVQEVPSVEDELIRVDEAEPETVVMPDDVEMWR
jgi:predicted MFS family arabinose efflux permease